MRGGFSAGPLLNVAIAVDSATDFGPNADRVVAAACDEVIGADRCPVARDLSPGRVAAWYAIVRPSDRALTRVEIEFRDRTADGVLIEQRSLGFSAQDSLQSRLASAGTVIAAMAAAREGSLAAPKRAHPPPAPPLAPAPALAPEAAEPRTAPLQFDLAALAVPTFGDGPARIGGMARGLLGAGGRPFALLSASYSAHPGNPSFGFWSLGAGAGVQVGELDASMHLELSAEVLLAHTQVAVTEDGASDSAGQLGWGGRVGVAAVWATWQKCSLIFGVSGEAVLPRLRVVVGSSDAERVPLASVDLLLGVRITP